MKYRILVVSLFVCIYSAIGGVTKGEKRSVAHSKMHKELLSNHKNTIDKTSVTKFLKQEIEQRESGNALSAESKQMINDLLQEAHKHIGKRYVHGAKGPSAFDCSGFSSYVYKQFGFSLSPSSRAQYTQGVPVGKNDLQKGDLVFFTSRSSGKNVGHVGIVVSADNEKGTFKFIHASIRGVKVSDFEGYYVPRYLGARRVITN